MVTERTSPWPRWRRAAATWVLAGLLALAAGGCQSGAEAYRLAEKASALWDGGRYQDAARNFVTLSELYPSAPLAEEALFWAASLYQHYLKDAEQAVRHYQHLIVTYPRGRFFYEAKLSLAELYEEDKETRHRALQVYQQLLLADPMEARRDWLHFRIGRLNLQMGKMDQARMEFRDLLEGFPKSELRAYTYYLIGYSYYLEQRYELALYMLGQTVKDFPGSATALRAQYFVADTLEERGQLREALAAYNALKGKYPNPDIVDKRIKTLQARIRRGVR